MIEEKIQREIYAECDNCKKKVILSEDDVLATSYEGKKKYRLPNKWIETDEFLACSDVCFKEVIKKYAILKAEKILESIQEKMAEKKEIQKKKKKEIIAFAKKKIIWCGEGMAKEQRFKKFSEAIDDFISSNKEEENKSTKGIWCWIENKTNDFSVMSDEWDVAYQNHTKELNEFWGKLSEEIRNQLLKEYPKWFNFL